MPIYYPDLLAEQAVPRRFSYTEKDVILYALSIGMGDDPLDRQELPFVYEKDLRVVPTAVTVLTKADFSPNLQNILEAPGQRRSNIKLETVLHGEQKIVLHRPLPASGSFTINERNVGAFDKGAGVGAVVVRATTWQDDNDETVATLTSTAFARSEGGFGGPREGQPEPHVVPERAPDLSVELPTRVGLGLLYRLNGDMNPLHVDPESAQCSGFSRPILHGLCTYGITCRAILQYVADFDATAIYSHQVRFAAPVYPGDTINVDIWIDGREISFEASVKERDVKVIKNGLTVLR